MVRSRSQQGQPPRVSRRIRPHHRRASDEHQVAGEQRAILFDQDGLVATRVRGRMEELKKRFPNGIDYVIVDNESTDGTMELLQQPYFAKHLIGYRTHPYPGHMDWESLMLARQAAVDATDTDWILYVSADEIMHSYNAGETLSAAIERADQHRHVLERC